MASAAAKAAGTKDVGHMYTSVYASMEASLTEAMQREVQNDELEKHRKREERFQGMVRLPVGEFYAEVPPAERKLPPRC